jgi:hypothetical protein
MSYHDESDMVAPRSWLCATRPKVIAIGEGFCGIGSSEESAAINARLNAPHEIQRQNPLQMEFWDCFGDIYIDRHGNLKWRGGHPPKFWAKAEIHYNLRNDNVKWMRIFPNHPVNRDPRIAKLLKTDPLFNPVKKPRPQNPGLQPDGGRQLSIDLHGPREPRRLKKKGNEF